jgi:hypothetical protein
VTDCPTTEGLCDELNWVWVEVIRLTAAVPWKVNSKVVFSHESWFWWVSISEIGTGTEFEPLAGTTREPVNVVEA